MKHSISLIPAEEDINLLITLQKQILKKHPNLNPILSSDTNLPHITIIQGQFKPNFIPQHHLEKIHNHIKSIIKSQKLTVNLDNLITKPQSWLFLTLEPNSILTQIHNFTFNQTSLFLENGDPNHNASNYTPCESQYYKKYGYRYIKEAYLPHFTIGKSKKPLTQESLKTLQKTIRLLLSKRPKITIDRLVFNEMGDYGSCAKEDIAKKI